MSKKDKKEKKEKKEKKNKKKVTIKNVESKKPAKVSKVKSKLALKKKSAIKTAPLKTAARKASTKAVKPAILDAKTELANNLKNIDDVINEVAEPTLIVISNGISEDGKIKIEMKWNDLFIKNINKNGIKASTEEDAVMLFLVGCQMRPNEFPITDEEVMSDAHPLLTSENHFLKR